MNRELKIKLLKDKGVAVPDDISDAELDALIAKNEIPSTQIPAAPPVPPPDQAPPNLSTAAPPHATNLVINGEVKSERELEIERRETALEIENSKLRETQLTLAQREKNIQDREDALRHAPTPEPKPEKVKRKFLIRTLINTEPDNE